jgi:glycosyltransferase involved in cell wall biosynthesis
MLFFEEDWGLNTRTTMFFTHLNRPLSSWEFLTLRAVSRCDHVMTNSREGKSKLRELGVSPDMVTTIYPGVDPEFGPRPIRIGVIGRPYKHGRKGEHVLFDLAWKMDLGPFHFVFVGDWDDVVEGLSVMSTKMTQCKRISHENFPSLYHEIDYLLSPGYAEGGPHSILEAKASGVPVISREVGIARDLGDCLFFDTTEDLIAILQSIKKQRMPNPECKEWTWENWAARHRQIWQALV